MKQTKRFISGSIITFILLGSIGSIAACRHHHHAFNPERFSKIVTWKVDDFLDDIDATADQRNAFNAVKDEIVAEIAQNHQSKKQKHHNFFKELLSDNPQKEVLETAIDEHTDFMNTMAKKYLSKMLELNQLLTEEQRQIVRNKYNEHFNRD